MVHQVTCFSDAYSVWENWNITGYQQRSDAVMALKNEIALHDLSLAKVMTFHLEQGDAILSPCHLMPGPTGETNELYIAGRGVSLLIQDEPGQQAQQALIAQLTCSLLAGNSVVIASDDEKLNSLLSSASAVATLPTNLVQVVSTDAAQDLLECDVRCVGFVGCEAEAIKLNRNLSQRSGAIVSFISETDLVGLPTALDTVLALRFVTERTRTINITAVGGNATLLELGSDGH